jgi:hypothetical protein
MDQEYEDDEDDYELGLEELADQKRRQLAEVEEAFRNNDNEEENENLKNLSKQAGKWKEKDEFKGFVSIQLDPNAA